MAAGVVKVLPEGYPGPDTNSRCQAFSSVSRPRNLEGPVPGPGSGRIGSSPALRTASRVGLTKRIEPCSPDGVREGHSPRRAVRVSPRYSYPRLYPRPRTDTWRWKPEQRQPNLRLGLSIPNASQLSGGSLEKRHVIPDFPTHLVHPAERPNLLRNLHPAAGDANKLRSHPHA